MMQGSKRVKLLAAVCIAIALVSLAVSAYVAYMLNTKLAVLEKPSKPVSAYEKITLWEGLEERWWLLQEAMNVTGYASKDIFKIFVFSGPVWGSGYPTIKAAAMNEETSVAVYEHEYGHMLGLPDLFLYTKPAGTTEWVDPTNGLDKMGLSNPEFSSWSRIRLGWIPQEWIYTVTLAQLPTSSLTIALLNDMSPGIHTVRITWGSQQQYALVERRPTGTYLFLVDESRKGGEGILTYNGTATEDRPLIMKSRGFSVVVFDQQEGRVVIGTVDTGEEYYESRQRQSLITYLAVACILVLGAVLAFLLRKRRQEKSVRKP